MTEYNNTRRLWTISVFIALIALQTTPWVMAQTPQFTVELLYGDNAVSWYNTPGIFPTGPLHLYGTFAINITDISFVNRVVIQNGNDILYDSSTAPFEWVFNTLDYPVGEYDLTITAYSADGTPSSQTVSYYFEHTDRSMEQQFGTTSSLEFALIIIAVGFSVCVLSRKRR